MLCRMLGSPQRSYSTIQRPPVHRLIMLQLALVVALFAVGCLFDATTAKSALAGGLICALPNAYFAWRVFKYTGARQSQHVLQSFYRGEAWAFLLTMIGFGVAFTRLEPINEYALFASFAAVKASHVLAAKLARL